MLVEAALLWARSLKMLIVPYNPEIKVSTSKYLDNFVANLISTGFVSNDCIAALQTPPFSSVLIGFVR